MATATVLRPHDCLIGPKTDRMCRRNPNPNSPPPRKRSPAKSPAKPFVGHVKILKRGEDLPSPETFPAPEKVLVYAGAAMFVAAPPPSSLPFPAFCRRKENNLAAECDIRRMLGLDSIRR